LVQALPIPLIFLCRAHTEHRTPPLPSPSTSAPSCSSWAAHPSPPRTTTIPWEACPHLTDAPKPLPVAGPPPEVPLRQSPPCRKLLSPSSIYLRPSPPNPTTPTASPPPAIATRPELGRPPRREAPRRRAPPRRRLGRRGNPTSGHPFFLPSPPMDAP
jgi:hypothetical protein